MIFSGLVIGALSMKRLAFSIFILSGFAGAAWAECSFNKVPAGDLVGVLAGRSVMVRASPPSAVVFQSKLERDDDGAPRAYHVGYTGVSVDPGLDHICNGGSVMEFKDGRLVNKYGKGGSIGELGGVDPASTWNRSALCKKDYINLRDQSFPACGPGNLCMLWYGIASTSRKCGYPSAFGNANIDSCGAPIRQRLSDGNPSWYYLTKTSLRRPGAPGDSLVQSDYVDASSIPFVVMPGGIVLPNDQSYQPGDLALVAWKGNIIAAIVGDTGPREKFGEGSRALLRALRGGSSSATIEAGVTTILLPGTAAAVVTKWPIDPRTIAKLGAELLKKLGGRESLQDCQGLFGQ